MEYSRGLVKNVGSAQDRNRRGEKFRVRGIAYNLQPQFAKSSVDLNMHAFDFNNMILLQEAMSIVAARAKSVAAGF